MARRSLPSSRFDATSDVAHEIENRRTFCLRGCQALSTLTLALAPACGGSSPAAPSQPPIGEAPPPVTSATPPPTTPAPPESPAPPETGPVVPLPTVTASIADGALSVRIDAQSPLAAVGGAALAQTSIGGITRFFLLARLTDGELSALNAVCTHEGCTVSRFAGPVFVCPCHGSRYTMTGEVVRGPAPAALPRYPTRFHEGVLTVTF
jgi:Rieske Fe-S protein